MTPISASHVTIIVSDITRDEPPPAFLPALRRRLPHARVSIAIATGTHRPPRPVTSSWWPCVSPLETINEPIFRIGGLPRFAPGVLLQLVSALSDAEVTRTLL